MQCCILFVDRARSNAIMYLEVHSMSFSIKYPAMYFENSEQKVFFTACRSCGWEDAESYAEQADCTVSECPSCGSDYIEDKIEWV